MSAPYVHFQGAGPVVASTGWMLETLQAEPLRDAQGRAVERTERLREAHRASAALLELVSRWNESCVLEMHWLSRPSLDAGQPGRVQLGLRLAVAAAERVGALEQCLGQALALEALLRSYWGWAEFRSVLDADEFRRLVTPFAPGGGLRVRRRVETIRLAHPFETRAKAPLGFSAQARSSDSVEEVAGVEHCFPWEPVWDDWGLLLDTLLAFPVPQWLVVRVANGAQAAAALRRAEAAIEACERFLAGTGALTLAAQTQLLREAVLQRAARLSESALRAAVLVFAPGAADGSIAGCVGQAISGNVGRAEAGRPYRGGFEVEPAPPSASAELFDHFEEEPFTAEEAACAFRLPLVFSDRNRGLPVRRCRLLPACLPGRPAPDRETVVGVNRYGGVERPIGLDVAHRLKHTFLIGMTGTGKSTALLSMLLQDVKQGRGVFLIDPHGELADQLLAHFPKKRRDDLILIDLADRERPVPLNVLAWRTIAERDVIVDELLATLLRIYRDPQMFGPVFETNFRATLKLLMGDRHQDGWQPTLVEFPHLYLNRDFRRFLLERTGEQEVKDFFDELERVRGENSLENLAPYITNKFARFLQDSQMRRIVGHGDMALDFAAILEGGKVVVVKLARGQFGASVADLLASHLVARMRLAAMARAAVPPPRRTPYFLYVDEFGSLARDENFSSLLSEARKYGLGLVLSAQYAAQLRDPDARHDNLAAVLGNVGTVICYRIGVEDARLLEPVFAPVVSGLDLLECPNFEGYMRLHLNGAMVRPFSFRSLPPPERPAGAGAAELIAASRNRWGVPARECDQRIAARRRRIAALR